MSRSRSISAILVLPALLALLIMSSVTLATQKRPPRRTPRPNLAQVHCAGTTHGLVFSDTLALRVYCKDTVTVGNGVPLQTYIDSGDAVLVPNGTKVEILSPRILSFSDLGARYVQVQMRGGYWKRKLGYILWEELAALPAAPSPSSPKSKKKA